MIFKDRRDAGRKLVPLLKHYSGRGDVLVLALPRGGVPVAFEVAEKLVAPLDIFVVRKLGVPGHEELAMGAIASGGVLVLNEDVVAGLDISDDVLERVAINELEELARREEAYRNHRPPPHVHDRWVILIDDGLATGASMHSAVEGLKKQFPAGIVIAVPVAARQTVERLRPEVNELVCVDTPELFRGVGQWYDDFGQTTDDEVRDLLQRAYDRRLSPAKDR